MRAGGRGSAAAAGGAVFGETLLSAAVLGRVVVVYAAGVPASRPYCTLCLTWTRSDLHTEEATDGRKSRLNKTWAEELCVAESRWKAVVAREGDCTGPICRCLATDQKSNTAETVCSL